jgi:hypothetical protein
MNKVRFTINTMVTLLFILAFASLAQAQATRTWVSGVGDDVNPCSRTAPCKTFAGAISKTAEGGEIDALDPAGYGTLTMTKSITVDGGTGAGWASVLSSATFGMTFNATTNPTTAVATLRNISINGIRSCVTAGCQGITGIRFLAGKALHIQNVNVFGFSTHGIDASLTSDGKVLTVQDSTIRECGSTGINVTTTSGNVAAVLSNLQIDRCTNGVASGNGAVVTMRNSTVAANTSNGVNTTNNSFTNITDSVFANNLVTGVNVVAGASVRLNNNIFANNVTGVANNGSTQSATNNKFMGNATDRSGAAFGAVGVQ